MTPLGFVQQLSRISLPNVFNPYSDSCDEFDLPDGPKARRRNLRSFLIAALDHGVDTVWMGRDLGYRGGRRTGIALTDEYQLVALQKLFPGCVLSRATRGQAVRERTAAEVWALLTTINRPSLLWNVFPFHPYEPADPFSNRRFTSRELSFVDDLNATLFSVFGIRRVIALGNDAATYAVRFGAKVVPVRHPSYGGLTEFRQGIAKEYNISLQPSSEQRDLF